MVETAVRPRPHFSTFLLSDANAGGDGLSFHEYKRLLRSQRVSLLQEKQSRSRVPGYKWSLPPKDCSRVLTRGNKTEDKGIQTSSTNEEKELTEEGADQNKELVDYPQTVTDHKNVCIIPPPVTNLTSREARRLKSGARSAVTARVMVKPSGYHDTARPQTARCIGGDTRDEAKEEEYERSEEYGPPWKMPGSNESAVVDVDKLLHSYRWDSSTKRGYNEVPWDNKLPPGTLHSPSNTSILSLPDPVSLRFTNKRNELYPSQWQSLGSAWDGVQSRNGFTSLNNSFFSPFKNTLHVPGYSGHTFGEPDRINGDFAAVAIQRKTPHPTSTSKKPNIPGYTGCSHWSNDREALSRLPQPNQYTIDFTKRSVPAPDYKCSPFVRTSPLSKMITLVSPFNPYNKIEHNDY
ncbi:PREDICTED: uncharacterized protein LOC100640696 [Amphimedon queenslandica]|uniref:Uncharacterized protein n=1 Tax=Amphimedon queenslandica TaxID=400682 RepID=A0A1X7VRN2_AMPQE|nr:PREDICTED: uncharacterized protein LOC100640696 [Amphimedon queenslandica]|eukprot:XP_003383123.1 PREDICTED: uncharacterized protein LOC100640696 [Amphimedon queenslandica]